MSTIKIEARAVDIDEKMHSIVSEYMKLMVILKSGGNDKKVIAEPQEEKENPGWFNRNITRRYEKAAEKHLGGVRITFEAFEIQVNFPAYNLFTGYQLFLYKLLDRAGRMGANVNKDVTKSAFGIATYLFARLAAIALSDDQKTYNGKNHIQVMKDFHNFVAKNEYFTKVCDFGVGLQTEHVQWMDILTRMVNFIDILNKPKSTLSFFRDYVESVRIIILKQLLVYIKKTDAWELDKIIVMAKLTEAENDLLRISNKDLKQYKGYEIPGDDDIERIILACRDKDGYLRKRYDLLKRTSYFAEIASALALSADATGWVLFFAGIVNVKSLKSQLGNFNDLCGDVLTVDDRLLSTRSKMALNQAQGFGLGFNTSLSNCFEGLDQLQDQTIMEQLKSIIVGALASVNNNQLLLNCGPGDPIIRVEALKQLGGVLGHKAIESSSGHSRSNSNRMISVDMKAPDSNQQGLVTNNNNNNNNAVSASPSKSSYAGIMQQIESGSPVMSRPRLNKISTLELRALNVLNTKDKKKITLFNELNDYTRELAELNRQQPDSVVLGVLAGHCLLRLVTIIQYVMEKPKINSEGICIKLKYDRWFHENLSDICALFYQLDKIYRNFYNFLSRKDRKQFEQLDYNGIKYELQKYQDFHNKQEQLQDVSFDEDIKIQKEEDKKLEKAKEEKIEENKDEIKIAEESNIVIQRDQDIVKVEDSSTMEVEPEKKKSCCSKN